VIETLVNIYETLEPLVLVAAGAAIQPLVSSWNERRKRSHELADRKQQEVVQEIAAQRQLLASLVDEAASFDSGTYERKKRSFGPDPRPHLVALRSIAIMSADQELIDAVERLWREPSTELPKFRALLAGRIQALESPMPAPRWRQRLTQRLAPRS